MPITRSQNRQRAPTNQDHADEMIVPIPVRSRTRKKNPSEEVPNGDSLQDSGSPKDKLNEQSGISAVNGSAKRKRSCSGSSVSTSSTSKSDLSPQPQLASKSRSQKSPPKSSRQISRSPIPLIPDLVPVRLKKPLVKRSIPQKLQNGHQTAKSAVADISGSSLTGPISVRERTSPQVLNCGALSPRDRVEIPLDHLLSVVDHRTAESSASDSLNRPNSLLERPLEKSRLTFSKDIVFLKRTLQEKDFQNLTLCILHVEFVPEWYLCRCIALVYENQISESRKPVTLSIGAPELELLEACSSRRFDYGKMLIRLKKLPFDTVVAFAQFILNRLLETFCAMEAITWIAALVESHFMEWTITDDVHEILIDLQYHISEEIAARHAWLEIEGKINSLSVASETKRMDVTEDRKYWHSVIKF